MSATRLDGLDLLLFCGHQPGDPSSRACSALLPILQRISRVRLLSHPESQADYYIRESRVQGRSPVVLSFRSLHDSFILRGVPMIHYGLWPYSSIPTLTLQANPRFNWRRMADEFSLILTSSSSAATAFREAGVRTPIRVAPVPLMGDRSLSRESQATNTLRAVPLQHRAERAVVTESTASLGVVNWRRRTAKAIALVKDLAWRCVPGSIRQILHDLHQLRLRGRREVPPSVLWEKQPEQIVFSMICDPSEPRYAWREVLSSFVWTLGQHKSATLLLCFDSPGAKMDDSVAEACELYQTLCPRDSSRDADSVNARVLILDERLRDEQRNTLIEQTTWYVNGSRGESDGHRLLEMMLAHKPALSPTHTAMSEFFSPATGLVIESDAAPCCFPADTKRRLLTTDQQLRWESLCRAFAEAYDIAQDNPALYHDYAKVAANAALAWVGPESVEARWRVLLDELLAHTPSPRREVA
jgi:hypothetical protein